MEEERVFLKIEMQDGDSALPISFLVLSSGEVWHNDTSLRQKDDKEVCERLIINVSSVANAMAGIAHTKLILNFLIGFNLNRYSLFISPP